MRVVLTVLIAVSLLGCSPTKQQDEKAIDILNNMGEYIGNLGSASFSVETSFDEERADSGTVQHNRTSDMYLVGPDKMFVYTQGDRGRIGLWYNGHTLSVYAYDNNAYDQVAAPNTIMATIDSIHSVYGVDFPAADFLCPSFTTDLLENNPVVRYVGTTVIQGVRCDHLMAENSESHKQIWVTRNGPAIPVRLLVTDKNGMQYEATISNWRGNPDLDSSMFEFAIPSDAHKTSIKTVNEES